MFGFAKMSKVDLYLADISSSWIFLEFGRLGDFYPLYYDFGLINASIGDLSPLKLSISTLCPKLSFLISWNI